MEELKKKLFVILEENTGIDVEDEDKVLQTRLCDFNMDSLDFSQFVYQVESELGIKFDKKQEGDLPKMTLAQILPLAKVCTS